MTLVRPVSDWPLLICGPILRRVTRYEVSVFVATKVGCDVQLQVGVAGSGVPDFTHAPVRTRALGTNLHVAVCHVDPVGMDLQSGRLYEYNVSMARVDTGAIATLLDQPRLLRGPEPLGYADGALPTFATAPGLSDLNLLHASCRKPHGGGKDALAMADQLIKQALAAPTARARALARPHQLLLTGDQIYADDVALTMLATLQEAGSLLCAQTPEETFPGPGVAMSSDAVKPGKRREAFVKANTTLTSDEAMNHLIFLAEFVAMYVLCWSDELWLRGPNGALRLGDARFEPELDEVNEEQRRELASFLATLRQVRRVLANVPTLMMFDDHEISDDWNLDKPWYDNTRSNPGQRRVVRNGLLAFAVFQAWGNDPGRFEFPGMEADLLDAVTTPPGGAATIVSTPDLLDAQLDLSTAAGTRMFWNWSLLGPEHLVIALDTRTARGFPAGAPTAPELLSAGEIIRQVEGPRPAPASNLLSFVIAPAPVIGYPFVEAVMQPALKTFKGGRAADNEAWCVNRSTYQAVLKALAGFGRVVVLSGDVHYAYSNHTAYFRGDGQPVGRIVQLCSSSTKNTAGGPRFLGRLGHTEQSEGWLGFAAPLSALTKATLIAQFGSDLLTAAGRGLFKRIKVFDLFEPPAVVPAEGLGAGNTFTQIQTLANRRDRDDWRYRTVFLDDQRNGSERLATALEIDPRPAPRGANHIIRQGYKGVVGRTNLGQIFVRTSSGRQFIEHRLHWLTSNDVNGAQTCTLHVAPLGMPEAPEFPVPVP